MTKQQGEELLKEIRELRRELRESQGTKNIVYIPQPYPVYPQPNVWPVPYQPHYPFYYGTPVQPSTVTPVWTVSNSDCYTTIPLQVGGRTFSGTIS